MYPRLEHSTFSTKFNRTLLSVLMSSLPLLAASLFVITLATLSSTAFFFESSILTGLSPSLLLQLLLLVISRRTLISFRQLINSSPIYIIRLTYTRHQTVECRKIENEMFLERREFSVALKACE